MDVKFFLARCTEPPRLTPKEIVLNVSTRLAAEGLKRCTGELACLARLLNRESVAIHWHGDGGIPYRVFCWQARSQDKSDHFVEVVKQFRQNSRSVESSSLLSRLLSETVSSSSTDIPQQQPFAETGITNYYQGTCPDASVSNLIIPELDLDFNGIYHNQHPIFFFDFEDGDIIFANLAAVRAQNKKLKKLLGSNAATLNFPEELERRTMLVWQGEQLREYENEAMRWFWDEELRIYRRKRMKFTSNAGRINFAGTACWYSHTINAEDTGRFVD